MKKPSFYLALAALLLTSCGGTDAKTVHIVQLGTHTSLNEINDAIHAKLKNSPYAVKDYNAEFSMDTISQIMASIKDNADLVIAIATPVAQAAYNTLKDDTPIVFAAVSDPVGAGLLKNLDAPEGNITGTSDAIQVELILDKALVIDPQLKRLGFIYNPAEANSVANLAKVDAYCKTKGIALTSRTISTAGEMSEVASALVDQVGAIFVSDDNTVASAMTPLSEACRKAKIPCYTGADSMVKDGGMFCIGINYTTLGTYTGQMALDILGGKKVSEVPVKIFDEDLSLYLNSSYVQEAGITIPSSILEDPNLVTITDPEE